MKAEFFSNGMIEIRNNEGELIIAGRKGAEPHSLDYHPMVEYAAMLMQRKGDWPEDPLKPQVIELVD